MKKTGWILFIAFLSIAQPTIAQEDFVLEGELTGFAEGTKLLICPTLQNMAADLNNDTAIFLKDGKFRLSGKIKEPTKYNLRVMPAMLNENPANYESLIFWVEAKPLQLIGARGNLGFATITGSEIQDEFAEFINTGKAMQQRNKKIKDSVLTFQLSEEDRKPVRNEYNRNAAAIDMERVEFVYLHPAYFSCVAELVYYINFQPERLSKMKTAEFYQRLSYDFKNNAYGKQIKEYLGKAVSTTNKPKTGDKTYPFALPDSSGNKMELASLKGKIILLDFWASGCGPCRQEHKNYLEVYEKYRKKGFEIVSVSQDQSKKNWLGAMNTDNMSWLSVWDANREVTKMYHINGIPDNYLIGKDGTIIAQDIRGKKLAEILKELLGGE